MCEWKKTIASDTHGISLRTYAQTQYLRWEFFVKWIPYIVWIDCPSEPLDGRSKDRDFDFMFKRKDTSGFRKCVGFRELKLRRVEIKVRVAF